MVPYRGMSMYLKIFHIKLGRISMEISSKRWPFEITFSGDTCCQRNEYKGCPKMDGENDGKPY